MKRGNAIRVLTVLACLAGLLVRQGQAATLSLLTNVIGTAPEILAYNAAHFLTNSNTKDWWRYAGVNGVRVFVSPSDIEAIDDLTPVGDYVTNQASFLARKSVLRADPLNVTNINWSYFSNRYETVDLGALGNNHIRVNYAFREWRRLGVQICAQITASESRLPISSASDWAGKWELWQHFYAQAFYMGRVFDVQRYQMYNEPDAAVSLTSDEWLMRLQLASDAIQSAIADVNALYSKSLVATILAPVNAGTADSDIALLGGLAVTNRHVNYLGVTDTNWFNLHKYDYHQYSGGASGFGGDLVNLNSYLTAAMSPEPRFKTTCTEFNTHTGATFDTLTETLDTPAEYADFGGICVALMANQCSELYAFKFGQTERTGGTYPVAKNAMHYVDNNNSPYNTGGSTRAGEVYRLFNKAFAPGRSRLNTLKGSGATSFEVHGSYDPVRKRYHLFSVNDTAGAVAIEPVFTTVPVPVGNKVLIEEVSESNYGTVRLWTNVPSARAFSAGSQAVDTVWLLTIPTEPQASEQIIHATHDAEVRDGTNKNNNYGSATSMTARNDPANTANRSAAFMKFDLGGIALTNIEFALLSVQASTVNTNATAQAHVYALAATNWAQASVAWATAPNLKQNVAAGNTIARQCVTSQGDTAFIVGQLVVNSTNASEKLIDVTDWLRTFTNTAVSFLVSQDPRWDVALPSLVAGDTQPDGIKIVASEGGNGPRLRLVLKATSGSTNTAPVALADAFNATEDTPLVVAAPGVLDNDSDVDSPTLSAVLVANATNGVVVLDSEGDFTYTPSTNFSGTDAFTYRASDGQADSTNTVVTISVAAVNDAPVAVNDIASTPQNTVVAINVITNDSDPDGNPLSVVAFTQPAHGTVLMTGAGVIAYSPFNGYLGADSFSYTITDGLGGTNSAMLDVTITAVGGAPYWTNLLVATEAFVRGGANAALDQDEVTTGYIMVKYNASPFDTSRKAYFQFNLTGLSVAAGTQAVFTVSTSTNTFQHRGQLWCLNQAYAGFSSAVTWNTAQANDTASNNLLTSGPSTAAPVGASFLFPTAASTSYNFVITNLSGFTNGNRVTLGLTGVDDAVNNAGGLRLARTNATLQVLIVPPGAPVTSSAPVITNITANPNGSISLNVVGSTNRIHWLLANTNLVGGTWIGVSSNLSSAAGTWNVTDFSATNSPQRFYRAVLP
jgi:VCBS repeat-containing protein